MVVSLFHSSKSKYYNRTYIGYFIKMKNHMAPLHTHIHKHAHMKMHAFITLKNLRRPFFDFTH